MDALFRDDPDTVLPLRVDPDSPELEAELVAVAAAMEPAWAEVAEEPEGVEVSVVGGGITNALYALRAPELPTVLVRIYGRNTEAVIDREAENRLFARLSRLGFAPPYLGRFENGRLEGFLEGHRTLQPQDLDAHQPAIARTLAELHDIPAGGARDQLWSTLDGWMRTASALTFAGDQALRYEALGLRQAAGALNRLARAWSEDLARDPVGAGALAATELVLSHNDLLAGNILVDEATGEARFIDYEYGACAPAAFDIANHLCEYAGFDSDFARHFPDRARRERFVGLYLEARRLPAGPEAVAEFTDHVDFLVLVDHLWWGSWAVVQAANSTIDFDFLEYARLRLEGLRWHQRAGDLRMPAAAR